MGDRIRIRSVELLSDGWTKLKKVVLDYRRRDGRWDTQTREVYVRGEAATVLPYDPERGTVLLVRQLNRKTVAPAARPVLRQGPVATVSFGHTVHPAQLPAAPSKKFCESARAFGRVIRVCG